MRIKKEYINKKIEEINIKQNKHIYYFFYNKEKKIYELKAKNKINNFIVYDGNFKTSNELYIYIKGILTALNCYIK